MSCYNVISHNFSYYFIVLKVKVTQLWTIQSMELSSSEY